MKTYLEEPVPETSAPGISIRLSPLIGSSGDGFPHKNINILGNNVIGIFRDLGLLVLKMLVQQACEQFGRYFRVAGRHILCLVCSCDFSKDIIRLLRERARAAAARSIGVGLGFGFGGGIGCRGIGSGAFPDTCGFALGCRLALSRGFAFCCFGHGCGRRNFCAGLFRFSFRLWRGAGWSRASRATGGLEGETWALLSWLRFARHLGILSNCVRYAMGDMGDCKQQW